MHSSAPRQLRPVPEQIQGKSRAGVPRVMGIDLLGSPARRVRLWAPLVLAAFLLGGLTQAFGESLSEPQQVVQRVSEELRRVLRDDRRLLETDPGYVHRLVDELLLPNLDFRRGCSFVLGPYWKKATAAQQEVFCAEFKQLLINTYATAVNELSEWEIRYLPLQLRPGDEDVLVRTRVLYPGGDPIDVDYRMHRKSGRWLVYDVKVAGVSFLTNYRSTFLRLAQRKGIAGLIEELAARNATRVPRS